MDISTEPRFLAIGRVVKPHGVGGEVRVEVHTDVPDRFAWLESVYVGQDQPAPYAVESVRFHQAFVLIKLAGVDTRTAADSLRNEWLLVPESEAIPLEEGEYFLHDLIGLEVVVNDGRTLGRLAEVLETGANNVFVVAGDGGKQLLIPDIPDVVKEIDFANHRMTVELLPGLIGD